MENAGGFEGMAIRGICVRTSESEFVPSNLRCHLESRGNREGSEGSRFDYANQLIIRLTLGRKAIAPSG